MDENQIILVDKPADISSFGVVAKVRGRLKAKFGHKVKVGHTGTLDPFATGLLILLSGKMTKKSNEFLKLDKEYLATLKLGYISDTGDPEGHIQKYSKEGSEESVGGYDRPPKEPSRRNACVSYRGDAQWTTSGRDRRSAPPATDHRRSRVNEKLVSRIEATPSGRTEGSTGRRDSVSEEPSLNILEIVIQNFIGKIEQAPPRFSAIKINGQRAYKLARKGQDFEIPSRKIEIYCIDILDYHYPELQIKVHCSSGTYVRTLAEDIGKALGTGAYLTTLRRTRIGKYDIGDAKTIDEI
ncbi:tRNA pseudouridine(55) synthase TruB [Candidatus Saccharibacteria bacterium]|nr:tRNA pseudouridine(55) synthase TruB [Candidatus Saccharibacteria bacterium]